MAAIFFQMVDGNNGPAYTFTWPSIGLKCKLVFCAFDYNKDGVANLL